MKEKKRENYEAPIIVPLGDITITAGGTSNCGSGSAATACNAGAVASSTCVVGDGQQH